VLCAAAAAGDDVDDALQLVQQGQAAQAYQLLAPGAADRAGDPRFDYAIGLAALDSGRTTEAVFAFERVLAVEPGHAQARAEIARAYFRLGEVEAARGEFANVQRQGVPAQVAEALQRYLNAIDQRATGNRRQLRVYVEGGVGHDDNLNSGPDGGDVAVPAFGGALVRLSDGSVSRGGELAFAAVGLAGALPIGERTDLVGGANLSRRQPFDDGDERFGTMNLDAYAGIGHTAGADVFTAALQAEAYRVDDHRFREAFGLVGGWNRDLDVHTRASAFVQATHLRFPRQHVRDANRVVAGGGLSHAFDVRYMPIGYASLYVGTEEEEESDAKHVGHELAGARIGGEVRVLPAARVFAGIGAEARNYGSTEPLFLRPREDVRYEVKLGAEIIPARAWSVTPQVVYLRNDSNIAVFDYDRTILSLSARLEFD
jgi:hypothetical protein